MHTAGDFFGEIAALTSVPCTADVVATWPTTLLQVPAPTLRRIMVDPQMHRVFLHTMVELPRCGDIDQEALRDLRMPELQPML